MNDLLKFKAVLWFTLISSYIGWYYNIYLHTYYKVDSTSVKRILFELRVADRSIRRRFSNRPSVDSTCMYNIC